jgi:hypothetical protein
MKKINENLASILDVEPIVEEALVPATIKNEIVESPSNSVVETDTELARQNIKELISAGSTAITELAAVARGSQHPRAYEVMATMMKNLADLNKDLLEIQKRKKDLVISTDKPNGGDVNIDKAVFVGSTADLLKAIKSNK